MPSGSEIAQGSAAEPCRLSFVEPDSRIHSLQSLERDPQTELDLSGAEGCPHLAEIRIA